VSVTTDEDTAKTGTLAGTDVEGSSLTFAKVADPTNGTVTINATTGAYTYTPNANHNGSDSFTFKVNDGTVDSAVATVSITVAAVNDVPVATAVSVTTDEDTAKTGTLAGTDVEGSSLTFAKVADPTNGTVTINAITGAYTYTPVANYNGSDSFTFKTNDGTVDSTAATVSLTVNAVNDAPTGSVIITGPPSEGQMLTASNTLVDIDGIPTSGDGAISYQWTADGVTISNAIGSTYRLTQNEVGKAIAVMATYADLYGQYESVSSMPTALEGAAKTAEVLAYSWKTHTLLAGVDLTAGTHSRSTDSQGAASFNDLAEGSLSINASRQIPVAEALDTTGSVNLQDAIAILKMIVGLNVNSASQALSPYQALAADFDGNGMVELNDAIGVLKHVVGLTGPTTPKPEWRFADEASAAVVAIKGATALSPGQPPAINLDLTGADASVHAGLVGYLRGDVDGSFAGAAGALDLDTTQPEYFNTLVTYYPALNLAQFGIYG